MGAAASINNQGQIVGYTEFQAGPGDTAFLWDSNNGLKNLTVLSGAVRFSGGGDINNSGQIPGSMVSDALGGWEACVWNAANDIRGLGILGSADYINDNGHVLGTTISGDVFLWDSSSGVHDLGFQYTPTGLNNNGQVVGYVAGTSSDGGHEADRAFVWDSTNGLTILGNLGDNSQAECVNNAGWIVGTYNGQAVLWEPVPEMSSMTGLLGGLAGFGMVWRRRNEYRRREVE
jgi:probable HAF family extracellular repeat protein